jgi:hypothetical protein
MHNHPRIAFHLEFRSTCAGSSGVVGFFMMGVLVFPACVVLMLSILHTIFQPCALEYLFFVLVAELSISGGCLHLMSCVPVVVVMSF